MSASAFQPGQRWVSNTESELGLGIVLETANRRVELSFPASGERRTYAIDNAPLSRVRYEVGQRVSNAEGKSMSITAVEEYNGGLIYLGCDDNQQDMILPELELDSFVQFSKPQDRLFAGQIDQNRAFQLRLDTLDYYRQLQQSPVAGLLGPRIQLLPHQLYIASETARRYAPRVLLADEVGLGKTIEAGLIIHQQLISGRASRVMIVVPDSLIHQWLVEMLRRFNLFFTILDEERCEALVESGTDNPFESAQLVLCTLPFLTGSAQRLQQAVSAEWDLLVVDEAHHLAWDEQHASPAYTAMEALARTARGLLLLTATPEQLGLDSHFARLRLLDPDRYFDLAEFRAEEARYAPVNELVQQLLAATDVQQLANASLQSRLLDYLGEKVMQSFNDELARGDVEVNELLAGLIRQLLDRHGTGRVLFRNTRASVEGFPQRDLYQHLLPAPDNFAATACNQDIQSLLRPELLLGAEWVQLDPRVNWLADFLKQRRGDKILVICARAATALALEEHLRLRQGAHTAVFHEGLSLVARDRAAAYFAEDEDGAQVLICSEIGSEGRNFQFSHQLVLFDLPLSPDLLEQRIGRLDRIGQRHSVQVHVPCYEHTAQQVLLRWYHEGANAFEQTCAIGQTLYQRFETQLLDCLRQPQQFEAIKNLLQETRSYAGQLVADLQRGRDRLLELNSFDRGAAEQIVEAMVEQERRRELSSYMEQVFDQFGVDQEHHTAVSVILRPGEHMVDHNFPGLAEEGMTATYQREMALSREDLHYLTWEHPMVTGAMDMVMSGDFGNTAFCTMKLPPLKAGTILLEAIFTVSCSAPASLQLHRYLPLTTVRVVVDNQANNLSKILTANHFNKLGQKTAKRSAQDFVRHARPQIMTMLKQADELAAAQQQDVVNQASELMQTLQQVELQRLLALAAVNPNIRREEVEHLEAETRDLQHYLTTANMKLDALRIGVITE